jgi:hypothetical protein
MNQFTNVNIAAGSNAATTQNGIDCNAEMLVAISGVAVLTGAPVGALTIQASNDFLQGNQLATNWATIPNTSVAVSAAGTYLLPKIDVCYTRVRIVWTPTSGTGFVTAQIKGTGF